MSSDDQANGESTRRKRFSASRDSAGSPNLSAKEMEKSYMASPHVEWTSFAESINLDVRKSRLKYPVRDWVEKKRELLAQEQAERLAESIFEQKGTWHRQVLKTIKDYPDWNDVMMQIVKYRMQTLIRMIQSDQMTGARPGLGEFDKVDTREIVALAGAVKTVTESKYRSLMLDHWSFKVADEFVSAKDRTDEDAVSSMEWNVQILGGDKMTASELQKTIVRWYDPPPIPHTRDELASSSNED